MHNLPAKDPSEKLEYGFDWAEQMAEDSDTIAASTWEISPTGLTVEKEEVIGNVTVVWLSGGDVGKVYTITNRLVTAGSPDPRTYFRSATFYVQDR